jgi:hypothetical protein
MDGGDIETDRQSGEEVREVTRLTIRSPGCRGRACRAVNGDLGEVDRGIKGYRYRYSTTRCYREE